MVDVFSGEGGSEGKGNKLGYLELVIAAASGRCLCLVVTALLLHLVLVSLLQSGQSAVSNIRSNA